MSIANHILAFPYHDPDGKLNDLIIKTLPVLQKLFAHICISATPKTIEQNGEFLEWLEQYGCTVYRNPRGSTIGDHLRGSLHTAVSIAHPMDIIHYIYIDRLLFALNTDYVEAFKEHITSVTTPSTLWERSELAWSTHPQNYVEIEQAANIFGKHLLGVEIELGSCAMSLRADLAAKVIAGSHMTGMDAATEWILLCYSFGHQPTRHQVDWLAWKDPFIEGIDDKQLKTAREQSPEETRKRLQMNAPFTILAADERFAGLLYRRHETR